MRQASKLALRTQAGSTLLMRKLLQKAVNPVTKTTQVVQLVVEFEEVPSGETGAPALRTVPTGRVRIIMGNWFNLPQTVIEKIMG